MLERLLRKAGTLPAMRVLDIGSGAGDVAAELLVREALQMVPVTARVGRSRPALVTTGTCLPIISSLQTESASMMLRLRHHADTISMTRQDFRLVAMLIGLLISASMPTNAHAVSIKYKADTAYVSGTFTQADLAKLPEFRHRKGLRTVSLNSTGGNLGIVLMAIDIANRKLRTRVEKSKTCASACFFVLLAGKERSVHKSARIGVHSPFLPGRSPSAKTAGAVPIPPMSTEEVASIIKEWVAPDINEEFLAYLLNKADGQKGQIHWATQSELRGLGIDVDG